MFKVYCSFWILVVILSNITLTTAPTTGWLRFCADGDTFKANPNECTGGYWLKKSVRPQCVCAHGIWILSKGYCDRNFVVAVGYHGTCFVFDAEVRWVRMLGYADNPFAPYHFVSNKYLDKVEMTATVGNKVIEDSSPIVGAISPKLPQEDADNSLCVVPKQQAVRPGLLGNPNTTEEDLLEADPFVFNLSPLQGKDYLTESWKFEQADVCGPNTSQLAYAYGAGIHQVFQYGQPQYFNYVNQTCNATCLEVNEWSVDKELKKILNESEISGDNLKEDYPFSMESDNQIYAHLWPECNETENNWHRLPNKTTNQMNEQTKRLMVTQINWSLYQHKGPEVNITEYNIFQKSRRIFEKVCPRVEIPTPMLRGVLRMFRHAVNESHPDDPYRRQGDKQEFERIFGALKQCFDAPMDQPITFVYNTTGCPPVLSTAIYKFNQGMPPPFDARNVSCFMPCDLRFNKTKYDIPVEAAWKVVLFTHYFCARHFKDIGYDHSRYYKKMEGFFNREIIHRWNNKGNSLKAMEFLFQMFDIDKFTEAMDCCVGAARAISQYRKWLKRPIYYQYCGQTDGQSYLEYKPDPALMKPQARFAMATNGGRFYDNNTDPIWNGMALCLGNWSDPLDRVQGYRQEATAVCQGESATEFWNVPSQNMV